MNAGTTITIRLSSEVKDKLGRLAQGTPQPILPRSRSGD